MFLEILSVHVTASTGMARLQYTDAKTLHHWSGYGDRHITLEILLHEIMTNQAYEKIRQNILQCDYLIIDEVGLISAKMFDSVELICQTVKGNDILFVNYK